MLHHSAFPFWERAPGGRLIRPARAPCQLTPQPPPPRPPGRLPPPSRPLHRRLHSPAPPYDRSRPQHRRPRPCFVVHAQQHRGPPASTHAAVPVHHPAIPCPQRQRACAPAPSVILPPPTRCPAPPQLEHRLAGACGPCHVTPRGWALARAARTRRPACTARRRRFTDPRDVRNPVCRAAR